ncbi:hypothetical protein T439DRAFT_156227 [Meredithblackwellia eburnea MCA 4105]
MTCVNSMPYIKNLNNLLRLTPCSLLQTLEFFHALSWSPEGTVRGGTCNGSRGDLQTPFFFFFSLVLACSRLVTWGLRLGMAGWVEGREGEGEDPHPVLSNKGWGVLVFLNSKTIYKHFLPFRQGKRERSTRPVRPTRLPGPSSFGRRVPVLYQLETRRMGKCNR